MVQMNWLLFGVLLLPLLVSASWDSDWTCGFNQSCEITVFTVNTSNATQMLNVSDCFITVWNSTDYSDYLFVNSSMDQMNASQGLHNFTILFNTTGHYPALVQCNGTGVDDSFDASFEVVNQTAILNATGFFGGSSADADWPLAVLLAFLGVIGMLGYYSQKFGRQNEELSFMVSNLNSAIRILFFLGSILLLIVTVNVARLVVEELSPASTNVIVLLDVTHITMIFVFSILMTYLVFKYIFELVIQLKDFKKMKGET